MTAAPQVYDAQGNLLSPDQVKAILGRSNARAFEVRVNDGAEEKKFGDMTVFKVASNGYRQPKTGVFTEQAPELTIGIVQGYLETAAEDHSWRGRMTAALAALTTED